MVAIRFVSHMVAIRFVSHMVALLVGVGAIEATVAANAAGARALIGKDPSEAVGAFSRRRLYRRRQPRRREHGVQA
jgi:hypothetical protein